MSGQFAQAVKAMVVGDTFEAVDRGGREYHGTVAETSDAVVGEGKWHRRRFHTIAGDDSSRMAALIVYGDEADGRVHIMDDGRREVVERLTVDGEEVVA